MQQLIDTIITAAIFVALGFVGAAAWGLFEVLTGYTASLFAMAGY